MNELDFTIEMNAEGVSEEMERVLFIMADDQLRSLADGYNDMIGAAVTVREPAANRESSILFEVTIVAYTKPSHTAATSKEDSAEMAMQSALDAITRQIRARRDQQRRPQEQPDAGPVVQEMLEIAAAEPPIRSEEDFIVDAEDA